MSTQKDVYFQALHVTTVHPKTGKQKTHMFAGRAMMTPEEIEEHKDVPIEDIIVDLRIDQPYNPYNDETNDKAAHKALRALREALKDVDDA